MKNLFWNLSAALTVATMLICGCKKDDPVDQIAPYVTVRDNGDICTFNLAFDIKEGALPEYEPSFTKYETFSVFDIVENTPSEFIVTNVPPAIVKARSSSIGSLTIGRYDTKAIYPSSGVLEWINIDNYSIYVPAKQEITNKVPYDTRALVFVADLNTTKTEVDFKSAVSLVKFQLNHDGINKVSFSFRNVSGELVKSYEVSMKAGDETFAKGRDYYVVVAPGEYASVDITLINARSNRTFVSSCTDNFSFVAENVSYDFGKIQGKLNVPYKLISSSYYPNMDEYAEGVLVFNKLPSSQKSLVAMVAHSNFDYTEPAKLYCYEYESTDMNGKPVTLSAALVIPEAAVNGTKPVKSLILGNHFSSMKNCECPTLSCNVEGLFAWKNCAVVLPDYYGFGSSSNYCQAYLNPDMAGKGSLDAMLAGKSLMEDLGIRIPDKNINIGYSQGGFNAIANLRYLALNPYYDIHFDNTVAGGGPYNVMNTFTSYLEGGFGNVFPLILVTLTSFNELENLGINYADIFKEPLLSNYKSLILSKSYDTSEVMAALGSTTASDHLTENLTSLSGPVYEKFAAVADKYSLTKGWTPEPDTKITLVHSTKDDMVPYSNFESLVSFLDGKCELSKNTYTSDSYTHQYTYIFFLLLVCGVL